MSSTAECIHGFEPGLCDVCFPSAPPERRPASRVAAPRVPAPRATATRKAAGTGAPVAVLDQRAYHVTHVANLPGILEAGALLAREAIGDGPAARPVVDVSSDLARELRLGADARPGVPVSALVPFALAPPTAFWDRLRSGDAEPRASTAAASHSAADFVVLAVTLRSLADPIVADADAAGSFTRFARSRDEVLSMLGRLHGTEQAREAEVLVDAPVALSVVDLIGVANEPMRDRVRGLLSTAGATTRVAVYPPWFQPAL